MTIYLHRGLWKWHYGVLFVCKSWWRWFYYFNLVFGRCILPLEMVFLDADTANEGLVKGYYGEILGEIS